MNNKPQPLSFEIFAPGKVDLFLHGDFTKDILPTLEKNIAEIHSVFEYEHSQHGVLTVLVDLQNFSGNYDLECFNAMAAFMNANKNIVDRSAVFGYNGKSELATEVVSLFTGRDNVVTFKNREEAVAWLESLTT